jgi:hypothetical protein
MVSQQCCNSATNNIPASRKNFHLSHTDSTLPGAPAPPLQVEQQALKKEKDPLSVARLSEVQQQLAALEDMLRPLVMKYSQEKERLDKIRQLQGKRQELMVALEMAEQRMDLARIADIK